MKLLNRSLLYISVSVLLIVSLWSVFFYLNMIDEIRDSIDDGLDNYKLLIINKADSDSNVLHKSNFDESNYAIKEILAGESTNLKDRCIDTLMYMPDEEDMEPVRMLSSRFQKGQRHFELRIISSMVEEDDLIEDLLWSVFWLYLLLIAGIFIINNLILRRLWKPFYSLLDQLRNYSLLNPQKIQETHTGTKEFEDLKTAANTLISHNLEAYNKQKQFIENASHELQTPLAIIINKIELLLEKDKLPEEAAETLVGILRNTERMARLNKTLLLLTKIENRQYFDQSEISINETLKQCLEDFEDLISFRNIHTEIRASDELKTKMDATLASTAISNLIRNAILHNREGGFISIRIEKESLIISNSSDSEGLDAEKIFRRFYKSEKESGGTGLGLAIVKAICDLYGFRLSYQFREEHRFEIRFIPN